MKASGWRMVALITWKKGKQQNETKTAVPYKPTYFSSQCEEKKSALFLWSPRDPCLLWTHCLHREQTLSSPRIAGYISCGENAYAPFPRSYYPPEESPSSALESSAKTHQGSPARCHLQPSAGWTLAAAGVLPLDDSARLIKQASWSQRITLTREYPGLGHLLQLRLLLRHGTPTVGNCWWQSLKSFCSRWPGRAAHHWGLF